MTDLHRRRTTPLALLLLVGATAGVVNSQPIPTQRLGIAAPARRTAAGQRAAQQQSAAQQQPPAAQQQPQAKQQPQFDSEQTAAQQPRALRDRSNRTPFVPQRVAPPQTFVAQQAAKPAAASAPQLLDGPTAGDTAPLPVVQDLIALQPAAQPPTAQPPTAQPPNPIAMPVPGPAPGRRVPPSGPVAETPRLLQNPTPLNTAPLKIESQTLESLPAGEQDFEEETPRKPAPFVPPKLTGIDSATTLIATPAGAMPRNFAALAQSGGPQPLAAADAGIRVTAPFYSTPRVADFTFRPLYFEERALERNGWNIGVLQPGLSFVHFFGTVPLLPYKMGANPPSRPQFTGNGIDPPSDHLSWRDRFRGVMTASGFAIGLSAALP